MLKIHSHTNVRKFLVITQDTEQRRMDRSETCNVTDVSVSYVLRYRRSTDFILNKTNSQITSNIQMQWIDHKMLKSQIIFQD
jgi:hypothetical protein